jgi:hypothetical protein
MRDTMESLCQLWKIMDSSEEEKRQFSKVISILITPEEGITSSGVLSQETIEKVSQIAFVFFFNRVHCMLLTLIILFYKLQFGMVITYADGS